MLSVFAALTFLMAALSASVNLINITQENAQNNENTNNNANANSNMNTNTNSKKKKRSLRSSAYNAGKMQKQPLDHIFNLVEFTKGKTRLLDF